MRKKVYGSTNTCTVCKVEKPLSEFMMVGDSRPGAYKSRCKGCEADYQKAYYAKNRTMVLNKQKAYADENPEARRDSAHNSYMRNKDSIQVKRRVWVSENVEEMKAYQQRWYEDNREKILAQQSAYYKANGNVRCALSARRRASRLNATPPWFERDKVRSLYDISDFMRNEYGMDMHVDHVIPLKNPNVSGLHCLANLRIIPARDNLRKSNRFVN
jgi:hypothetical protein